MTAELLRLGVQLRDQGYAVLAGLYGAAEVAAMRAAVLGLYDGLGRPPTWAQVPVWPQPWVEVSTSGLVMHRLLGEAPHLQHGLLHPHLVQVLQAALGPHGYLEFVAAQVCDKTRPFFAWHHHAGGIDDELFRRQGRLPDVRPVERVSVIIYLEAMQAGSGQLLVDTQRRVGAAPFAVDQADWPGHLRVSGPPGTVVLFDQGQWHAVTPRTDDGLRAFVGMWFAAAASRRADTVDSTLDDQEFSDPLVRQAVACRPHRTAPTTCEVHG